MSDLISLEQAAQDLGVHVQTIRRFIHSGTLKAYKVTGRGNRFMVERGDLDKLKEPVLVGAPAESKKSRRK